MAADSSMYTRGISGRGLILSELIDILEENDIIPENVAICPPEEPPDAETDKDSDLSDEEVLGDSDYLPSRILMSQTLLTLNEENDYNHLTNDPKPCTSSATLAHTGKRKRCSLKSNPLKWTANKSATTKIPQYLPEFGPSSKEFLRETVSSPVEAFRKYFTDYLLSHIVTETNRYAGQKLVHNLNVSSEEILTFVGVMLVSGYHQLPYRRLYWKQDPDVHVALVSNAIRRNRFDEIMCHLHLADNESVSNDGRDKLYKVRPVFDILNSVFKQIPPGPTISIDESMIPYYGKHGAKQFIRGKPIRFGFKLWVAADPSGYIHHVEPYCGSSTRLSESGLGQGGDVVLGLLEHLHLNKGTKLYFDNLFTSTSLLQKLTAKEIGGTGTLRENRCNVAMKLPDKKNWKKEPRGQMAISSSGDLLVVRWKDNNVVTVLTNCDDVYPMKKSLRYSRTEKKKVSIDMPGPIAQYNSNMGGVDISDQFLATYRSRIRSKKWWWPFFSWAVDVCCVQSWLLYRQLGHGIPLF